MQNYPKQSSIYWFDPEPVKLDLRETSPVPGSTSANSGDIFSDGGDTVVSSTVEKCFLDGDNRSGVAGILCKSSIGSEMRKIRPCIVVSPDEMNKYLETVIIVPLTSTIQSWPVRLTVNVLGQKSSAACDQLRAIDKSRLKAFIGKLKPTDRNNLFGLLQSIFSE